MTDLSKLNSNATSGPSAAQTVASSLSSRRAVQGPRDTPGGTQSAGGAGNSSSGSSDITANDFLTLLVSELKNQDPTQPTDPNQYITQLTEVNSLQQLISINQGIGTLDGSASGSNSSSNGSSGSGSNGHSVPGHNAI
jgi:flagellar basal-body rod modification protein FlgD